MRLVRSLASLLVLAAPALAAQSAKPIPVRDFFRNPAKAYFQVSQGGKYVSFTEPYQSRMNIMVRPSPAARRSASRRSPTGTSTPTAGRATTGCSSSRIPAATRTSTCTSVDRAGTKHDGPDADAEGPRQPRGRAARQRDGRPRGDEPSGLDGVRRLPRERGDGRHDDDRAQPGQHHRLAGRSPRTHPRRARPPTA